MKNPLQAFKQAQRNMRLLGAAALAVLGGLVVWLVIFPGRDRIEQKQTMVNRNVNNEWVTKIVESGAATTEALEGVATLAPYRDGFIGVTREPMTLEQARDFAEQAGAEILDLSLTAAQSTAELRTWLQEPFAEWLGNAMWVCENAEPRLIDPPDILLPATDAVSLQRFRWQPHRVLLRWPRQQLWSNKGWSWTIPAGFDEAKPFSAEGVARVRTEHLWGMVDREGRTIQPPMFDLIEDPDSEHGSYRVSRDKKWGVLDRKGRVVTGTEWDEVQPFIRGFAPVRRGDKWGYVDSTGRLAIPCQWDDAWRFSLEGYAIVTQAGKRGFIDRTGRVVVPPVWDGALNFTPEGVGMVRTAAQTGEGWGLIDTSGRILTQRNLSVFWKTSRWLEHGLLTVRPVDGGFSEVIGLDGRPVPGTRIDSGQAIGELYSYAMLGEAIVPLKTPLKMISRSGEVVRDLDGHSLSLPPEGPAIIETAEGSGFLDNQGDWLIKPRGATMKPFYNGLAACGSAVERWEEKKDDRGRPIRSLVQGGGPWGFIDRTGQWVIQPEWDEVKNISLDGFALVKKDNRWGIVHKSGRIVSKPRWDHINCQGGWDRLFEERMAAVRLDGLWGFIDETGTPVIAPKWDAVGRFVDGFAAVSADQSAARRERRQVRWTFLDRAGQPAFGAKSWLHFGNGAYPVFSNGTVQVYTERFDPVLLDAKGLEYVHDDEESFRPQVGGLRVHSRQTGSYLNREGESRRTDVLDAGGSIVMEGISDRLGRRRSERAWNGFDDAIPHATPPKYGLMNAAGRVLVEPSWDDIRLLSPDWVWFKLGGKCGLADRTGQVVIAPEWDELTVLAVRSGSVAQDGKNVLIGSGGEQILSPWVRVKKEGKTHILRTNGQRAIPDTMPDAEYVDFYGPEHIVITQPDDAGGKLWSLYAPSTGRQVKFPGARTFRWNWNTVGAGLIWQGDKDAPHRWRLMSKEGRDMGHSQPAEEKPDGWGFFDGLAPLHQPDGWAFVSPDARPISTDRWEAVRDFSEGRAAVAKNGKWGFVGTDGRPVCQPLYDEVGDFKRGLAACRTGVFWGYLGVDGTLAIPTIWDSAEAFEELKAQPEAADQQRTGLDVALVSVRQKRAVIDRTGRLLTDPKYAGVARTAPDSIRAWTSRGGRDFGPRADEESFAVRMPPTGIPVLVKRAWKPGDAWVSPDRAWRVIEVSDDVEAPGQSWRLINETGAFTGQVLCGSPLPPGRRFVDPLAPQAIVSRNHSGKLGLLRRDGTHILLPKYDRIVWIDTGVAAVWSRDEGGLVTAAGEWIFKDSATTRIARFEQGPTPNDARAPGEPISSEWRRYRHGLVAIEDTPKWGYARLNR